MEKKSIFKSNVPFLPLFILYVVFILSFSSDGLIHDEGRYLLYAQNLTQGFYADTENPELRNGPGYPLVLSAFVLIKMPYIGLKLLNAIFLIIGVVYFFKALNLFITPKKAMILSYILGLYPPLFKWLTFLHSEVITFSLICAFLYYFLKLQNHAVPKSRHLIASTGILGLLALTKVIFGYVIISCAIFCFSLFIFNKSKKIKLSLIVFAGAFMLCMPYLYYTYSLTEKKLYWGTQGGEILYWRSSPFPNEYGDWISADAVMGKSAKHDYYDTSEISKNHRPFIQSLEPYSYIERDEKFRQKAFENMWKYPSKYIQNTFASGLRLFFNYPFSYTQQKMTTYFYIIPNSFLLIFLLFSVYLAIRRISLIPFEIRFLALLALLYMGGLVLLNGKVRYLVPIIPLLLFFIIFMFSRFVGLRINHEILPSGHKQDQTLPFGNS